MAGGVQHAAEVDHLAVRFHCSAIKFANFIVAANMSNVRFRLCAGFVLLGLRPALGGLRSVLKSSCGKDVHWPMQLSFRIASGPATWSPGLRPRSAAGTERRNQRTGERGYGPLANGRPTGSPQPGLV